MRARPPGACAGLLGGKAVLGSWFRSRHVVRFLESSQSLGMSPCELGVTPLQAWQLFASQKAGSLLEPGVGRCMRSCSEILQSLEHLHGQLCSQPL